MRIGLIYLFLLCGTNAGQAQENDPQVIIDIVNNMWKAMEEKDVATYMGFYHPEYTTFGEYDRSLRIGKEAEEVSIAKSLSKLAWIKTEMREPRVSFKGNMAWVTYYWEDEGVYNGMPYSSEGKSSRIFEKKDGKWLCIHSHFTLMPDDSE